MKRVASRLSGLEDRCLPQAQTQGKGDFPQAGQIRRCVLRRFVALDLLLLQRQPPRKLTLAQPRHEGLAGPRSLDALDFS